VFVVLGIRCSLLGVSAVNSVSFCSFGIMIPFVLFHSTDIPGEYHSWTFKRYQLNLRSNSFLPAVVRLPLNSWAVPVPFAVVTRYRTPFVSIAR